MVLICAYVDNGPVTSAVVRIILKTNVARDACRAAIIPQYVTSVQPKFALDQLFVCLFVGLFVTNLVFEI